MKVNYCPECGCPTAEVLRRDLADLERLRAKDKADLDRLRETLAIAAARDAAYRRFEHVAYGSPEAAERARQFDAALQESMFRNLQEDMDRMMGIEPEVKQG